MDGTGDARLAAVTVVKVKRNRYTSNDAMNHSLTGLTLQT